MKKITKEYEVFNFDELSEEVKQNVIDKYYEKEDYPFLEDDMYCGVDHFNEYNIFEDVKLQYSLRYCQGDGLSFECNINILNFLNNLYSKKLPEYKKNTINEYIWKVYSKGNNGMYCYASKSDIDFDCNYCDGIDRPLLDKLWNDIMGEIEGYSILDYRMSFDEFSEHCECNEYRFLENGKIF